MKQLQLQIKSYLVHPIAWIMTGIACCILSLSYHLSSQHKLDRLKQTAMELKKRKEWTMKKEGLEKQLLSQLKSADRDYVEKELESLKVLTPEIKKLKALLHSDPNNASLKERLGFLESGQNTLHFREQNFQRVGNFQEVDVIQDHPVEMNRDDLKALIARIENKAIGSFSPGKNPPSILIKKFELFKKPMSSNEETYLVNLELTKHEIVNE